MSWFGISHEECICPPANGTVPAPLPPSGVVSVFGRIGDVIAQAGDYDVSMIAGAVPDFRSIIAGAGLTGGGPLSGDVPGEPQPVKAVA